jgi:UDP-glucose 4-epimerase
MAMASDVSGETFNVVTGEQTTVKRIVEILLDITGSSLEPDYGSAGGAVKSTSGSQLKLSRAKIERMLGWVPEVDIEQGLRRLIAWRAAQPD